ncbi:MAG: cation transporter [Clostridia bacterium]|nr:cation transporter [Clostridia bacterium]
MKRAYRLVGLDCANCAAKMEHAISKLSKVSDVNISFMTAKMTLVTEDGAMDEVLAEAERIIKRVDPDVVIKRI